MNPQNHRIAANFAGVGHPAFAVVLAALGICGIVAGDFAGVWQRIPIEYLPARSFFADATAVVEIATGIGLLFARSVALASRVALVFSLVWLILLKVPAILAVPSMEATWLGFGEIGVIAAGAWILFARFESRRKLTHMRIARCLFAVSLPMIGLSHFFYTDATVKFIPAWIPFPEFWAYLTGAASIATCVAVLTGVLARLATMLEAAMLIVITVLVWTPGINSAPIDLGLIVPFLISSLIACGAWIVADSYRDER